MREEDIRPHALMVEKEQALEQDVAFLLKRKAQWVDVCCPACSSSNSSQDGSKSGFQFKKCIDCETVYTSPRPDLPLLGEFYSASANYEFWNRVIFPSTENVRKKLIYGPRAQLVVDSLVAHGVENVRLCEVGAAFGWFLEAIEEHGIARDLIAIEPSESLARTCEEKGYYTISSPLELVELGQAVDVIAAFEVIEHVFSPRDFLAKCLELLNPGGWAFLSCPNVRGFDLEILGKESGTFQHEHLNYFHPESVRVLLERVGFEAVEVRTPGLLDVDIVHSFLSEGPRVTSEIPWLGDFLLRSDSTQRQSLQEFLQDQGQSSHMFVSARKKATE